MGFQDTCSQFLPCMAVWWNPRGGQETTLAASKPNPSMPVCVGTLDNGIVPLWNPTIATVGWADQSEGMETESWYLGHLPCLTLYHIYAHLGHMGESYDIVQINGSLHDILPDTECVCTFTMCIQVLPSCRNASKRACAPSSLKSQDSRMLAAQSI